MYLRLKNMVFVKISHGIQICHKCHFLKYKKVSLNWSLEVAFGNYIWMHLQNANSMCK